MAWGGREEIEIHRREARGDRMQKDWGHQRVQTPCSIWSSKKKRKERKHKPSGIGEERGQPGDDLLKAEKSHLLPLRCTNKLIIPCSIHNHINISFLFPPWPQYWEVNRVKTIFSQACSPLMKMLFCGSPSFHSCWQFPSISWTRPLLSDWPVGTSSAGCYGNSRPPGPNLPSPAPLLWFCPIVALETRARR